MSLDVQETVNQLLRSKEQLLRLLKETGNESKFDVLRIEQFNQDLQECMFQIEIISKRINSWMWRFRLDRRVSVPKERRVGSERRLMTRRRDDITGPSN